MSKIFLLEVHKWSSYNCLAHGSRRNQFEIYLIKHESNDYFEYGSNNILKFYKIDFGAWLVVNFLSCPLISTWYQGHDILHEQNYLPLPWQSFSSIFTSFYFLLTTIIFPTNPVLPMPQESFPSSNLLFDGNCLSWASFLIFWSRYHHQFLLDIWSCLMSMALVEVVTWSLSIYSWFW